MNSEQAAVLRELENLIGQKIPKLTDYSFHHPKFSVVGEQTLFGFYTQDDNVIGLMLHPGGKKGYKTPLKILPESIGRLKFLKILILSYNKLTTLPESIGNLLSLQTLDLGNNEITSLPESICNLKSLEILKLAKNKIESLPESMGNLQSLKELRLEDNHLTSLPESMFRLKSLQDIDFTRNRLAGYWAKGPAIAYKGIAIGGVLNHIRKAYGINIFISHALADQDQYQIVKLNAFLKVLLEVIRDTFICETDLLDDIWDFMTENVPKSHLLLFIATKNSIASVACRYELFLANKFNIEILPIKGKDISWEDLSNIELMNRNSQPQGTLDISNPKAKFEFDGTNFDGFKSKLKTYIMTNELKLKNIKTSFDGFENTKKNILDIINSDVFRNMVKENLERFEQLFQEQSSEQILNSKYFLKLGEILKP